jgi:3-oxoacyl-[acyl-carrier-protein] synthase II
LHSHHHEDRVVITGVGLTSPLGNDGASLRRGLLAGESPIRRIQTRFMGSVLAGVCEYDELKHQSTKERRRGTRAGSIATFCANEAVADAGLAEGTFDRTRAGVFIGVTEHGTVETENEIAVIREFGDDTRCWSHHHNPRTVANNPAGEVTINMGITGPHYTIGAACAAGNAGLINGVQMLRLGEVDVALCGGVSEAVHSFGIFASFASQGALAQHPDPRRASRPFDKQRNGIVVSEGGCIFVLERLESARRRGARIIAEVVGHAMNSDASDPVLPNAQRLAECMRAAIARAGIEPAAIDIVSTHATGTQSGDELEVRALREVFAGCAGVHFNNAKSFIGHAMGAAGALELAGNLGAFDDQMVHATINIEDLDPECALHNLIVNEARRIGPVDYVLNNSFGMLGINSAVVVKRYVDATPDR